MRIRRFIFALPLCLAVSAFCATPSPTPTPTPKPRPPLKPTEPVKPLQKASPTPSEKPTSSPPAKTKSSPSPAASSSPSPSPSPKSKPSPKPTPALKPDAELDVVAEEYIRGYLAARPLHATALGFHEYDGRINDDTRLAIDAEIARLRRFDDGHSKFDLTKLAPPVPTGLRVLQPSIK